MGAAGKLAGRSGTCLPANIYHMRSENGVLAGDRAIRFSSSLEGTCIGPPGPPAFRLISYAKVRSLPVYTSTIMQGLDYPNLLNGMDPTATPCFS
jgi:hypothetical protein